MINTYSNRRVANHLHGLIFELKERMDSRQDRPVMKQSIYGLDIRLFGSYVTLIVKGTYVPLHSSHMGERHISKR
jgi:hypothetical protein